MLVTLMTVCVVCGEWRNIRQGYEGEGNDTHITYTYAPIGVLAINRMTPDSGDD